MKSKKIEKLVLNKETISHLELGDMNEVKGGETVYEMSCATNCKYPESMCWCRTIDGPCVTLYC